jgi:peptidoglycan hydrolase CwlO-like protein
MKFDKQTILLIIITCLAAYSIFQGQGIRTDVAGYNAKIELIQTEIDSLQEANVILNEQILTIDKEIDDIDGDINNVAKNITIIKTQTNEKIDAVNEFTFSDLYKFFSDRYEPAIDTTGHNSGVEGADSKTNN